MFNLVPLSKPFRNEWHGTMAWASDDTLVVRVGGRIVRSTVSCSSFKVYLFRRNLQQVSILFLHYFLCFLLINSINSFSICVLILEKIVKKQWKLFSIYIIRVSHFNLTTRISRDMDVSDEMSKLVCVRVW